MKKLIVSILFLYFAQAHAGVSVVGNGGDVIDCGSGSPLTMLDVFEATVIQKGTLQIARYYGDENQILKDYLINLKNYGPYQTKILQESIAALKGAITWVNEELEDIPDSQHILLPAGCKIRQIAIQYRKNAVSKIKINYELYDRLDDVNKVAFWMHEGIYSEAIDLGHTNSIGTRNLNGFLLTTEFYGGSTKYEGINWARRKNNFPVFETAKNGDTVIKLGSDACGFSLHGGLTVPCKEPIQYAFKDDKLEFVEFSTPFQGFGLQVPVKKLYFYEPKAQLIKTFPVTFDGHEFKCSIGEPVQFSVSNFVPGEGFFGSPLITKCLGSYAGSVLPSHVTQNLFNEEPVYRIQFDYVFNRTGAHAAGIKYSRKNGKWNLGFTPYESLNFNSYQEHWYANQIWLKNVTGNFTAEDRFAGDCNLAGGTAKILMRNGTPYLLQAKVEPYPSRCAFDGGFGDNPRSLNPLRLSKFKRDNKGNIYWGIQEKGASLYFRGSQDPSARYRSEWASFKGPVEIRDGLVVKGRLEFDRTLDIDVNGVRKEIVLKAGTLYEFTDKGFHVVEEENKK